MAGVYLVNVLDVARSLGINPTRVTPEMVAQWLITEYMKKRRVQVAWFANGSAQEAWIASFRLEVVE